MPTFLSSLVWLIAALAMSGCGGGWGEFKPKVSDLGNQIVKAGDTASFTVQATGTGPISYKWYRNDVPIPGASAPSYSLVAKPEDDGMTYSVGAENAGGTAMSAGKLTVLSPPVITKQPATQSVLAGQAASFSVTATGTGPLTFQWFANGQPISGANAASYTTPEASITDAGDVFTVQITNQVGSVTSAPATLAVSYPPGSQRPVLSFAVANTTFGAPAFPVAALSNSGGVITYSAVSGPAIVSGNMVTVTGAGPVVLMASLASDGVYAAASATATFQVAPAAPTITFSVADQKYGAAPFPVKAVSNSDGALTYTVVSGPANVSGDTVTVTGCGLVNMMAHQAAAGNYASGMASTSFQVTAQIPTLVFSVADKTFGDAPFAVNASSPSSGTITYAVISGPATISGNTVTLTGAGPVVLSATQTAADGYGEAKATTTFNVGTETPQISFTVPNQTFRDQPFPVAATSTSPGPISYSVVSGPATIVGNLVTLTGVGPVVLSARQAASGGFGDGSTTTTFTVNDEKPTLALSITNQTYGGQPVLLSATSNSSGAILYSVVSGPATISGDTLTTTAVGTVTVQALQASAGPYSSATSTASFNVTQGSPVLTVSPISDQTLGSSVPVVATSTESGSGAAAIVYSVTGPATISGNVVTTTGAGKVTVTATQTATADYAASSASISFNVGQAAPVLTLASIATQTYGAAVSVSASSSETGSGASPITYSVTGPATITGSTVTTTGVGKVTVTASQAASSDYAAGSTSTSFDVKQATPVLSVAAITNAKIGDTVALKAISSENGPDAPAITYVVTGPATISGGNLIITGAGAVTITASQAASTDFTAVTATTSFTAGQMSPGLTIAAIPNQTYGDTSATANATSSSSESPITYSVTGPAVLSGTTITVTGVGTVTVTASQAASADYASASASTSFNVSQATPKLTLTAIADQTVGSVVSASATSTESSAAASPITYSITGPATLAGNTVTATGSGTVTVTATQAASTNYKAASTSVSFQVDKLTPTLSIAAISTQTFGGPTVTAKASSSESGSDAGAITLTVSGPATINGNTITSSGAGTVTVTATQAATSTYNAATATASFEVKPATPTLTVAPVANQVFGNPAVSIAATSNSPGNITYTLGNGSPATLTGSVVTATGVGTVTIVVAQEPTSNYAAPNSVTLSFSVGKATPVLAISPIADQTDPASVTLATTSTSTEAAISYAVSGPATLVGSTLTTTGKGTVTVTASQTASVDYNAAVSVSITFTVYASSYPTITLQPVDKTVCLNDSFTLSVDATNATSFQWYQNGVAIAGATGASYSVGSAQSTNQGVYFVVVSNAAGVRSITSASATVIVGATITANPASLKISAGQTATLAVSVSGDGPFTYQWYSIALGASTGTKIAGATTSSYTTAATVLANSGTQFYVLVTDACGNTVVSGSASLTVSSNNYPPVITLQPVSQHVEVGDTTKFIVAATGSGTLTYQWYVIAAGTTTPKQVVGATASSYTLPITSTTNLNDQDEYFVVVTNSYGQATSQQATLIVGSGIQITKQPATVYVNSGNQATFSVAATSSLPLTYQWFEAAPGTSLYLPVSGATAATYTIPAAVASDSGATFYVVVSNGAAASVTSGTAAEMVDALTNIPTCSTDWNTSGNAFALTGATTVTGTTCGYQLTAAAGGQQGDIVWPTLISTGSVQVNFTVTTSSSSNPPADGFAVVLGDPTLGATITSTGDSGQGLGARGIPGVVFAFDDYANPGDPAIPYVGVTRGETLLWETPYFYDNTNIPALAIAGQIVTHSYVLTLVNGQLTISMDGLQILSGPVVVPPVAYLYVTSSTGAHYEQTQITNISAAVSALPAN